MFCKTKTRQTRFLGLRMLMFLPESDRVTEYSKSLSYTTNTDKEGKVCL